MASKLKINFSLAPETVEEPFASLYSAKEGFYRGEPGGIFVSPNYALNGAEKLFQLKPRVDDVWLVTFPKTGRTIIGYLLHINSTAI